MGIEFTRVKGGPSQASIKAIRDVITNHVVPLNSLSVMPDGSQLTREQILKQLNLNPNTPPDAWLTVAICGSNASALNLADAERLVEKGVMSPETLQAIQQLQAGE